MGLFRRLVTAWILGMIALAGGRFEVSTPRGVCESGCCCSDGTSCCQPKTRIKITSPCGCGHDEGRVHLDLSTIVMGPLEEVVSAARPGARFAAIRADDVPVGRVPSPEVPPPRSST